VEEGGQTVFSRRKPLEDKFLDQLDPTVYDALSSHKKWDDVLPSFKIVQSRLVAERNGSGMLWKTLCET